MVEVYELWTVIVSLIIVKLCIWIYQWSNPKCSGKLPPGSMGFPIMGETFEFMKPHDAFQLPGFVQKKILRYGPLFRTSLFGAKVIVSTDTGLNMEIAKTNHVPGMPKSLARLFGENNLFVQSKESHKHVRSMTTQFLGSQGLKMGILKDIDLLVRTHMKLGAKNSGLDVKETTSKILVECLAKKVMGEMEPEAAKELAQCWTHFPKGWFRFSWNIPGTGVYQMMKARKRMIDILKETVLRKRASGEELGEFFKMLFGEMEGGAGTISVESAVEYVFIFFLIANEATPSVLAATVINESLRITSTVPTVLRIFDREFKVGDYTIPAGWIFMGYANTHFNPEKYEEPLTFNPWRWKEKDMTAILSKTYIPFGAGSRLCLGADFAKLLMATFIHHLCRYRWSMKKETRVLRRFILMFPEGSGVQISEDTEVDNSAGY
ncbi:unnamed protein product [Thlaspi arvense]|uniref:Cytochrome P450 n=1 Tax=Thlaspi arvense TaxID=13288 RepID=A0AAU9T853_THLAR|nr:unnamed protein product [Thlaspi arvense]